MFIDTDLVRNRLAHQSEDVPKKYPRERNQEDWMEIEQLTQAMRSGLNLNRDHWMQMSEYVKHSDLKLRYEGTKSFRMMLSVIGDIPIQSVIETGVVPSLVDNMKVPSEPPDGWTSEIMALVESLRLEASWALTNIASGTAKQTEVVVNAGVVPLLVDLLRSPREDLREQGIWGLGNVAGDRAVYRDLILSLPGALDTFIQACMITQKSVLFHTAMWSVSNLCRGKPRPEWHLVSKAASLLVSVLLSTVGLIPEMFPWSLANETDVLADICWALDGISEARTKDHEESKALSAILPVVPALLLLLRMESLDEAVQRPAIRLLGQIAAGTTEHTRELLKAGVLPILQKIITRVPCVSKPIRKDICWTLSNIAAGPSEQVRELIATGTISLLTRVVANDDDFEVRKEAAWAIANAVTTQSPSDLFELLNEGCLRCVMDLLEVDDIGVAEVAVDSLRNILELGMTPEFKCLAQTPDNDNVCVALIKALDGTTKLLRLHNAAQAAGGFSLWKKSGELLSGLSSWGGI